MLLYIGSRNLFKYMIILQVLGNLLASKFVQLPVREKFTWKFAIHREEVTHGWYIIHPQKSQIIAGMRRASFRKRTRPEFANTRRICTSCDDSSRIGKTIELASLVPELHGCYHRNFMENNSYGIRDCVWD